MSQASGGFQSSVEVLLHTAKEKDSNFASERDELTMVSSESAHGEVGSRHQYAPSPVGESPAHDFPIINSVAAPHLASTEMKSSAWSQNQQLSQAQASTSPSGSALVEDCRASSVEVVDNDRHASSRTDHIFLQKPMMMQSLPPPLAPNHTVYPLTDSLIKYCKRLFHAQVSDRLLLFLANRVTTSPGRLHHNFLQG